MYKKKKNIFYLVVLVYSGFIWENRQICITSFIYENKYFEALILIGRTDFIFLLELVLD